jgi:pilus assembly protein CpaE
VASRIIVIESTDQQVAELVHRCGLTVASSLPAGELPALERHGAPDLLIVDLRQQGELPAALPPLRRRLPLMGVVIVASKLDPELLLEAMRAGVNEVVTDLTVEAMREAIARVTVRQTSPAAAGQVVAFLGAKGGVGTTTIAVNVAAALAEQRPSQVLMADFHVAAHGDAALLLGVEPRFSVVDGLENTHRLDEALLRSLCARSRSGVDVLASPERPALRPPTSEQMRALLEVLAAHYPYVVVDVPRTDLGLIDAIEPVTGIVLVVNQELPTVRRAAQVAGLLRQRYGKDRVSSVVSRYDPRAEIGQEDIERVVGLPVRATLPSDYRKVVASANVGRPLIAQNHSRLASSIRQLALGLVETGDTAPVRKSSSRTVGLRSFF